MPSDVNSRRIDSCRRKRSAVLVEPLRRTSEIRLVTPCMMELLRRRSGGKAGCAVVRTSAAASSSAGCTLWEPHTPPIDTRRRDRVATHQVGYTPIWEDPRGSSRQSRAAAAARPRASRCPLVTSMSRSHVKLFAVLPAVIGFVSVRRVPHCPVRFASAAWPHRTASNSVSDPAPHADDPVASAMQAHVVGAEHGSASGSVPKTEQIRGTVTRIV